MAATQCATCSGQDLAFEQCALRVERAELFFRNAVHRGALRAPTAGEDAAAADDSVGVHAVDADAVLTELGREESHLVGLVRFRRAVRDVVRTGEHRVLRDDVHDVARQALLHHHPSRSLRDEEAALRHDVVLEVPLLLGRFEQRLGDGESGVVDDEVDATESEDGRVDCGLHLRGVGHVGGDADRDVGASHVARRGERALVVEVGDGDAGTFGCELEQRWHGRCRSPRR